MFSHIRMEPSALAGMAGSLRIVSAASRLTSLDFPMKMAEATHLVWGTGGRMVPDEEMNASYARGKG